MVNVRNVQGEYAFLHVLFRKPFGYFSSLSVFHHYYDIRPRDLLFGDRFFVVKPGRLGVKLFFKKVLSCFASVHVLVADEEYVHNVERLLSVINFTEQERVFL